jgi:hypothetical protein
MKVQTKIVTHGIRKDDESRAAVFEKYLAVRHGDEVLTHYPMIAVIPFEYGDDLPWKPDGDVSPIVSMRLLRRVDQLDALAPWAVILAPWPGVSRTDVFRFTVEEWRAWKDHTEDSPGRRLYQRLRDAKLVLFAVPWEGLGVDTRRQYEEAAAADT